MPRVLTCIDPQPLEDGSCQTQVWIEQPSVMSLMPTVQDADMVGKAFFFGIVTLAALVSILKPSRSTSNE